MPLSLLGISGSLTKGGSTRAVIDTALRAAKTRYPEINTDVLDLRDVTLSFCDGRPLPEYPDDTPKAVGRVQAADAYIIGTPIYRGSYTGSLKNLLDHVPVEAMMGKVAGLVVNGSPQVPRADYNRLRAVLHDAARSGPAAANRAGHPDFRAHLLGRISWVRSTNPERAAKLDRTFATIAW